MKTSIISLGGSLIAPSTPDSGFLDSFRKLISGRTERFAIICGGGATARNYQDAGRILGFSPEELDWIGIHATILNAALVKSLFPDSHDEIISDPTAPILTDKRIIICSGWKPGFSTDLDAVKIAHNLGAQTVINLSNISHVFDKDPKKDDSAEKIERMSWKDYLKIVGTSWTPGMNAPFDPIAAQEAQEHRIEAAIMDGKDISNLASFLDGKGFQGTLLTFRT